MDKMSDIDLNKQLFNVVVDSAADNAVKILNEALELEPDVIRRMFYFKFCVGPGLVEHPTIQVLKADNVRDFDIHTLGVLGLINGLFGIRADGYGRITGIYEDGVLVRFESTKLTRGDNE